MILHFRDWVTLSVAAPTHTAIIGTTMQLERVLRWIVLGGIFAMPLIVLIVSDSLFFPYVTGKNFTFRIIVEVMFGAWLLLALLNAQYRPRLTVLFVSLLGFVGIVGIANIFGENPYKSFWSNFERMEGYVTILHLLAYFVVAGTVMVRENLWLWFWRISLVVSTFVSLHTIFQSFSTDTIRLFSTLGNPIYLAVYMLFHIFMALLLSVREEATQYERVAYLLSLPLLVWAVYLTSTRGATLGIIGGLLLAALGIAVAKRRNKAVFRTALILVVSIAILVGGFWMARDTAFVRENPLLQRFASISLTDQSIFARTVIWSIAWSGIKEKPLLGWGQENFNLVFAQYYDPRMYAQEEWFDRTHNIVFDWLIAAGVLGLLAYISIFLSLLWIVYKTQKFTVFQKWLIVGLLAAYSFNNLTVFDTIISYILFFSVVAWIYATATDVSSQRGYSKILSTTLSQKTVLLVGVPVVSLFVITTIWFTNVPQMQVAKGLIVALTDISYAYAYIEAQGSDEKSIARALEYTDNSFNTFQAIETKDTFGKQVVREQWATVANRLSRAAWLPKEKKLDWYNASRAGLEAQEARSRNDPRFPYLLAALYDNYGREDMAWSALLRANELSPEKQTILLQLGTRAVNADNFEVAEGFAKRAFESDPTYTNARVLYAFVLIRMGREEESSRLIRAEPSIAADSRILAAYVQRGEYARAREMWELGTQENEKNIDKIFALVSVYVQKSDTVRANAEIEYVLSKFPELKEQGVRPEIQIQAR